MASGGGHLPSRSEIIEHKNDDFYLNYCCQRANRDRTAVTFLLINKRLLKAFL